MSVGTVRALTPEEVAHHHEHGWALLRGLVPPAAVSRLRATAERLLGEQSVREGRAQRSAFGTTARFAALEPDGPFADLLADPSLSAAVRQLLGRDVGLRYGTDSLSYVPPGDPDHPQQRVGWHQDFGGVAHDRSGGTGLWLALDHVPAGGSALEFLSGSPAAGALGRTYLTGLDLVEAYPDLPGRFPVSPPVALEPGDATSHSALVVHRTPDNLSDRARWAFSLGVFPADTLFTGAQSGATDGLGLTVGRELDDPRFPLLPR